MKKFFGIIALALVCVLCVGCSTNNNAKVKLASQKLSTGLDKIVAQVKKMETIDVENLDISNMLGDYSNNFVDEYEDVDEQNSYSDEEVPSSPFLRRSDAISRRNPLYVHVPTKNKFVKNTNADLRFATSNGARASSKKSNVRNKKNFNFVSKDAEKKYGSLYTACNNCCDSGEEFNACKSDLLKNCSDAKNLLNELAKSGKTVSESDLKALNGYYEVLSSCLSNLQSCKSCSKNVKMLGKKKANLASNCGAMKADYLQIFNCLDSNCCSCQNANASVTDLIDFVNNLLGKNNQAEQQNNVLNAKQNQRYKAKKSNFDDETQTYENNFDRKNNFFEHKKYFDKNKNRKKFDNFEQDTEQPQNDLVNSKTDVQDDEFANYVPQNRFVKPRVVQSNNQTQQSNSTQNSNNAIERSHLTHIYPNQPNQNNQSNYANNQSNYVSNQKNQSNYTNDQTKYSNNQSNKSNYVNNNQSNYEYGKQNNTTNYVSNQNKMTNTQQNNVQQNYSTADEKQNLTNSFAQQNATSFANSNADEHNFASKHANNIAQNKAQNFDQNNHQHPQPQIKNEQKKSFSSVSNQTTNQQQSASNASSKSNVFDGTKQHNLKDDEKSFSTQSNQTQSSQMQSSQMKNDQVQNNKVQRSSFSTPEAKKYAHSHATSPRIVKTSRGMNNRRVYPYSPSQNMFFAPKSVRAFVEIA